MFHRFTKDISTIALPDTFTCPFCYAPHLLSIMAANQVQTYIQSREDWREELQNGKMFGVLVVKNSTDEVGFVAAFSGQIQGQNIHEYFVPPVYDLIQENGFFKKEEFEITLINRHIEQLQSHEIFEKYETMKKQIELQLSNEKRQMQCAKEHRDEIRKQTDNEVVLQKLIRESQFRKAEYKRLQQKLQQQLNELDVCRCQIQNEIDVACQKRKELSCALQRKIFEHFVFLNALGEEKNAFEIWNGQMPPAGAGECAAPRLLQYAYANQLKPIAMAEFWWGKSPKGEVRRQGSFYKACKLKCEPILQFMLQGLKVEENRFAPDFDLSKDVEILFEDEHIIVVNKPIDVLSVPGNIPQPSMYQWAKQRCGIAYVVHRLDMATSGILLIAKTLDDCRALQRQFENHSVQKEYVALLDGVVESDEGEIALPMRPDFDERPIQVVDEENGKVAVTRYKVLERKNGKTKVLFFPQTGRTHQLRVHSAYYKGLNCPIVGDTLYGTQSDRLYLHAQKISFKHPVTNELMTITCEAKF